MVITLDVEMELQSAALKVLKMVYLLEKHLVEYLAFY